MVNFHGVQQADRSFRARTRTRVTREGLMGMELNSLAWQERVVRNAGAQRGGAVHSAWSPDPPITHR